MNNSGLKTLFRKTDGERMIPFVEKRKIIFLITGVFFLLGILCMVIRGFAWDTDFIGGTAMEIHIGKPVEPSVVEEITELTESIIGKKVSSVRKTGDRGEDVLIKCTEIPTEVRDAVFEALKERYGLTDADRLSVSSVGGSISADFRRSASTTVRKIHALSSPSESRNSAGRLSSGCRRPVIRAHAWFTLLPVSVRMLRWGKER